MYKERLQKEITISRHFFLKCFVGSRKSSTFALAIGKDAEIAQLVEHNLAKVGVASSSLVFRSPATNKTLFENRRQCPRGGMVDALVSGASVERRASSILVVGTQNGEVAEW